MTAGRQFDAVVFDLLTALIDSWTLWNRAAGSAEDGLRWRRKYLELTYAAGRYRPYEAIVREAAIASGVDAAAADRLIALWPELPLWSETPRILDRLASRVALGVATNCSKALGMRAVERTGGHFAAVVTAETAGFYKPRPEPYQAVLEVARHRCGTDAVRGRVGRGRARRQGGRHAGFLAQPHASSAARKRQAGLRGGVARAAPRYRPLAVGWGK